MNRKTLVLTGVAFACGYGIASFRSSNHVEAAKTLAAYHDNEKVVAEVVPRVSALPKAENNIESLKKSDVPKSFVDTMLSCRGMESDWRKRVLHEHIHQMSLDPNSDEWRKNLINVINDTAGKSTRWIGYADLQFGGEKQELFLTAQAHEGTETTDPDSHMTTISSAYISIDAEIYFDHGKSHDFLFFPGFAEYSDMSMVRGEWVSVAETFDRAHLAPIYSALVITPPGGDGHVEYLDTQSQNWLQAGSINWSRTDEKGERSFHENMSTIRNMASEEPHE